MQPIVDDALLLPGMWISPAGRVYLTTGISLAAVAVATWTGMMAGAAERMVADPDGYFAAARQRAERELAHQSRGLFPALHRKHHR